MWWKRVTPAWRAASSMAWVPSTLVRKNRPGSRMARLLWDSAAKWTIGVDLRARAGSRRASSPSQMSPWTKLIRSSTSARLGRLPA